ncbi:GntR family transcriptional regulator [Kitasatospora sp. NPDC048286]|uniref:GntR family transcriptional regulator n=1 Tax=Kitasatospora sp. NPDC048286 TaxID=3364047 RepID=UPI00371A2799
MPEIDPDAPEWPYRQIATTLRTEIRAGLWEPGKRLSTEKALCERFGVARETLRRALDCLREDGLIFTIPHRGTYVVDPLPAPTPE